MEDDDNVDDGGGDGNGDGGGHDSDGDDDRGDDDDRGMTWSLSDLTQFRWSRIHKTRSRLLNLT